MNWVSVIADIKAVFMVAFAFYAIKSVTKGIWKFRSPKISIRERLGSLGLLLSTISATMFLLFYAYIWFGHMLIAHGEALFLFYYTGETLAWIGLIIGLFGSREIRTSSVLVSIVMIFQWYGTMVGGTKANAVISAAMFIVLAFAGFTLWLTTMLSRRRTAYT